MVERTGQTTDFSNQTYKTTTDKSDFFKVDSQTIDGESGRETRIIINWDKWHGYYRKCPEYRAVIDKLASWTFGRGIKGNKKELDKLKKIKGWGKDSPRGVLKNQWKTALICGDSFAEIIKDNQGRLTNLKPINPGIIAIVINEYGIIIKYELLGKEYKKLDEFQPEEIFHLSNERIANEGHGIPFAESLENLIESRNEGLMDLRILYHRNIKPIQFFEVETDDEIKLNNIETTINNAYSKSENVVIPSGVVREIKRSSTPQYGTLDSLSYIKFLVRQFVTSCGVPEVVMGWGAETTEASSKIIYLAFQQEIEDKQLYIQEMIEIQLNIKINLEFPASLEDDLKEDNKKDSGQLKEKNVNPKKDG